MNYLLPYHGGKFEYLAWHVMTLIESWEINLLLGLSMPGGSNTISHERLVIREEALLFRWQNLDTFRLWTVYVPEPVFYLLELYFYILFFTFYPDTKLLYQLSNILYFY